VGAGEVGLDGVPPVKLTALARCGMTAKAPVLRGLASSRRVATLLATLRHLETVSVDDAVDLFDVLMATMLLAQANRAAAADDALRALPKCQRPRPSSLARSACSSTPPQYRQGIAKSP
jgi:hypothetical protein